MESRARDGMIRSSTRVYSTGLRQEHLEPSQITQSGTEQTGTLISHKLNNLQQNRQEHLELSYIVGLEQDRGLSISLHLKCVNNLYEFYSVYD